MKMDEVIVEVKPGTYPNLDDIVVEDDAPTLLLPCITCNKTFKPEALQRHSKVCERNATKKRKTFDSFKQRVQGTELAEFLPFSTLQKKVSAMEKPPSPNKASSRWKENHEAFVSAIRAARGEGSDATGGSGEPRSLLRPSGHEQCPYCERHFGPKAFDRHQEWCREQHSRQPPVTASSLAKERLEARIKYRAPPLRSKRAITREKYSPLVQRKVRQVSPSGHGHNNSNTGSVTSSVSSIRHTSQSQLEQSNRLSRSGNSLSGRSQAKEVPNQLGFNRGMAGRTSLRASQRAIQRSNSPGKRSSGSGNAQPQPQLPSHEEPRFENYDKESMLFTPSNAKKLQTRSQTLKQHDGKMLDYQKIKPMRKHSQSSVSAPNSETLQIEVKSNEVKESNNNKNLKNDHLWRQGHIDKHSVLHFSPSNSLFPEITSGGLSRSLLKNAGKPRMLQPYSPNSVERNDLVTEMVVLPLVSRQSCSNQPRNKQLKGYLNDMSVSLTKGISSHDLHDDSYKDEMYLIETASPVVLDIASGSALGLGFDSCKVTSVSSSHSTDSNRTYTARSLSCFEIGSGQEPISESKAEKLQLSRLESFAKESQSENAVFSVSERNRQKKCKDFTPFQITGNISKYLKRSACQEQNFERAKRNRRQLRKQIRTTYHKKLGKTDYSCGISNVASLCPLDSSMKSSISCIPAEVDETALREDSHIINTKSEELHGHFQQPKISIIEDNLILKKGCTANAHGKVNSNWTYTTWRQIAINGCQASQYFVLNTYSKLGRPSNLNPSLSSKSEKHISESLFEEQIENVDPFKTQFLKSKQINQHPKDKRENSVPQHFNQDISLAIRLEDSEHSCHPAFFEENLSGLSKVSEVQLNKEEKLSIATKKSSSQSDAQRSLKDISVNQDKSICSFQGKIKSNGKESHFQKVLPINNQNPIEHQGTRILECSIPILPIQVKLSLPLCSNKNLTSIRLQPLHFNLSQRTLLGGHILPSMYSLRLIVDGKRIGNRRDEHYDPYASAERQMMELLRSDSAFNINSAQKCKTQIPKSQSPAPSLSPMPSPTLSPKPSPLETSPTSAFTRYAKESEFSDEAITETESGSTEKSEARVNNENTIAMDIVAEQIATFDSTTKSELNELDVDLQLQPSHPLPLSPAPPQSQPQPQPQPPPRSYKRLASLQHSNDVDLVVCGVSASRPQIQTSHSLDFVLKDIGDSKNLDNRPKTYDLPNHHMKASQVKDDCSNVSDQSLSMTFEFPAILNSPDGRQVEILNLENRENTKGRHETRESREIREITEQKSGLSDIDNLLEEVVRMQHSVSMFSEVDSPEIKEASLKSTPQTSTSARSRRNRTGKMHIEDFLFPTDLLERENNNFKSSGDTSEQSRSVFGSTKSRKSSSKGRRLIEDMLFPPGNDFNANSDNYNEDGDVVVSENALSEACSSSGDYISKRDSYVSHLPTSPVTLTSKVSSNLNESDGLPRPKPVSLSTHSSTRNGLNQVSGREPVSIPTSPMQHQNHSRQSNSSRLSGDSAYSSLNRKSPVPHVQRQSANVQDYHRHGAESPQSVLSQSLTQSLALSSSGSESSLPPLTNSQSSKRGGRSKQDCDTPSSDIVSATTPLLHKLSKFCHQCGTKFLIPVAKFCHECGAPRLEIC